MSSRALNPDSAAVYSGQNLLGSVVDRRGQFEAVLANGRTLGLYNTLQAAANAITFEHDRLCDPAGTM